jgi:hypothetical protein
MTNPFRSTEPWEVSTETILGPGNHVVTIVEAEDGTSSGGHPQVSLLLKNREGQIRAWQVITDASIGQIVALAQSAGIQLPGDEDIVEGLRLRQSYYDRLIGKQVGIVVREEPSWKDPTKMRSTVAGYVDPAKVQDSDVTPQGAADQFAGAARASRSDDDMPF